MPELIIYGASDDLLEVSGLVEDEFGAWGGPTTVIVTDPDGARIAVTAEFDPLGHPLSPDNEDGAWVLSVHHRNGRWLHPIRLGVSPGRCAEPAIFLDVPEGTTVRLVGDDDCE